MKTKLTFATVGLAVLASVVAPPPGAVAAQEGGSAPVEYARITAVVAPPAEEAAVRGGPPAPGTAADRFWELQLNLCNSGVPGVDCYSQGRSIAEAADLIRRVRPDMVTLNEICANDLPDRLTPSMAEAWPGDRVYHVFAPAIRRDTGTPVKCANGQDFGNAVLGRVPAASFRGVNAWSGRYTTQDGGNEQRTFVCAYAVGHHLGCATHLSASSEPVALAQCRALLFDAVPHIRSVEAVSGKTVVGGDFNLEYDTADPENAQNCVPPGHTRKGDGDVQHVVFSNDLAFAGTTRYGLAHTDHDGFLVRLTKP
ncbi:Endonuclease/Exonuclease/phosphatase family protein [Lentzea xinjiangensis]|uniref:Endonuclease/Exonuclease/phosphatase family protein n=1 Tax=Lentzea xinjiangensis TaxID=402600 RepID=A0A1H9RHC2_9PSEU|nr:endonuclease/exonuclease/phosphatase family protein [Lentzea xinjiangensis]SER72210.1 Endonuclease/Exonuclease/phosphatase family protein [Lentzea xinjiangensis]